MKGRTYQRERPHYKAMGHIHNTSFSSYLTNRHNRVDCYVTLNWKGLPVTNTLTVHKLRIKLSFVSTAPEALFLAVCKPSMNEL